MAWPKPVASERLNLVRPAALAAVAVAGLGIALEGAGRRDLEREEFPQAYPSVRSYGEVEGGNQEDMSLSVDRHSPAVVGEEQVVQRLLRRRKRALPWRRDP